MVTFKKKKQRTLGIVSDLSIWAMVCLGARHEGVREHIYTCRAATARLGFWNELRTAVPWLGRIGWIHRVGSA
jgi:hypothetical protein